VLVATRIHRNNATGAERFDPEPLRRFIRGVLTYADAVAVAVDVGDVFLPRYRPSPLLIHTK
jgi:hypothetical protein